MEEVKCFFHLFWYVEDVLQYIGAGRSSGSRWILVEGSASFRRAQFKLWKL